MSLLGAGLEVGAAELVDGGGEVLAHLGAQREGDVGAVTLAGGHAVGDDIGAGWFQEPPPRMLCAMRGGGLALGRSVLLAAYSAATVLPTSQPQVRQRPLELPGMLMG